MGARPSHFRLTAEGPLRLYSTQELLAMPAPTYLVEKMIPANGFVGLYGESGIGKTFAALDMALAVATGEDCFGRKVQEGHVLYVSAEGGRGIGKRAKAWLLYRGITPHDPDISWLIESLPVYADSTDVDVLMRRIEEIERTPSLIVFDTLARCFEGNENQQEDMGRFVAGVDRLRQELGTAVVIVHHTGLGNQRERGSSAFRGAADTMLQVTAEGAEITLTCSKQKDDEPFEDILLELQSVAGTESCVLVPSSATGQQQQRVQGAYQRLREMGPSRWDAWFEAVGLDPSQRMKVYTELKGQGLIEKRGDLWVARVRA